MNKFASSRSVGHAIGFARRFAFSVPARKYAILICILPIAAGLAQARIHRSQAWAETQFNKAESRREALNSHAAQARTRREYEAAIASYRQIVLDAPTSSKADGSAFAVAELTAEMGRHFKDDMALYSAVREYKFLRREYPGSKHRVEALLAIGEIYKNDLGDSANARATFEEFLRRYQHSDLIKEARAELASLNADTGGKDATGPADENGDDDAESADVSDEKKPSVSKSVSESDDRDKVVRINSIDHKSAPDYTRITVGLEQNVQFESQRIDHPDRIFFDLKNARLSSKLAGTSLTVDDRRVKKIRVAQYKPGRARIVVETVGRANFNASLVLNPPRLVIDVHDNSVTSAKSDSQSDSELVSASEKSTSSGTGSAPKKVIVEASNDDPAPDAEDAASVTRAGKSAKLAKQIRHGNPRITSAKPLREAQPTSDGDRSLGTIGPNGLLEKNLVLDVSKRLGKLLGARLGAQVAFTRRDDTFIPLETRTAIANQEEADLFVSVHANSSRDPDARGVETYYLNFTSSPEALEVAARENAASDKSIHELQDL
ncbi:MAG: hypothetical protein DMG92_00400, partial [Acidobacteria bacterium]